MRWRGLSKGGTDGEGGWSHSTEAKRGNCPIHKVALASAFDRSYGLIVDIVFDPKKDQANLAKHGISLARAAELEILAFVDDHRFDEPRFRLYGLIDGEAFCVAGAMRNGIVRVISLRRAHAKEMRRHVD